MFDSCNNRDLTNMKDIVDVRQRKCKLIVNPLRGIIFVRLFTRFWYIFSIGIIGGILVSTFTILFFMPALYEMLAGKKKLKVKGG